MVVEEIITAGFLSYKREQVYTLLPVDVVA